MSEISADFNCHDGQFLQLLVLSPQKPVLKGPYSAVLRCPQSCVPSVGLEEVDPTSHLSQGKDVEVQD